jgi:hypothetical protein
LPPATCIVKGGANLRLFFNSRRRSQDVDLDYAGSARHARDPEVAFEMRVAGFLETLQ